jgi:hypothetical protein
LAYLTQHDDLPFHPFPCKWHNFILLYGWGMINQLLPMDDLLWSESRCLGSNGSSYPHRVPYRLFLGNPRISLFHLSLPLPLAKDWIWFWCIVHWEACDTLETHLLREAPNQKHCPLSMCLSTWAIPDN